MNCSLFLREELEEKNRKIKRLNFLYGNYEPSCWWFDIFEMCRRLLLTAGVSFLNPGSASQILFSIICGLGSMRIYSGYKPFIDPKLDRLAEVMQWQIIFTMLAALALKVNIDGETLEDKFWFDAMLILLQFAGPIALIIKHRKDGGVKEIAEGNVDFIEEGFRLKESIDEGIKQTKQFKNTYVGPASANNENEDQSEATRRQASKRKQKRDYRREATKRSNIRR